MDGWAFPARAADPHRRAGRSSARNSSVYGWQRLCLDGVGLVRISARSSDDGPEVLLPSPDLWKAAACEFRGGFLFPPSLLLSPLAGIRSGEDGAPPLHHFLVRHPRDGVYLLGCWDPLRTSSTLSYRGVGVGLQVRGITFSNTDSQTSPHQVLNRSLHAQTPDCHF